MRSEDGDVSEDDEVEEVEMMKATSGPLES
jgi:hypothetical protein